MVKVEWQLLDSGDTKSQTDHSEVMVFGFCLLSLITCLTILTVCMFYKERTYRGREARQDAYFGGVLYWGNKI